MDNYEKFKVTIKRVRDKINSCKHLKTHLICEEDYDDKELVYCTMEVCDKCGLVLSTKYSNNIPNILQ